MRSLVIAFAGLLALSPAWAADAAQGSKLDAVLEARAETCSGTSRVIIQTRDGRALDQAIVALGGTPGRRLPSLGAQAAEISDCRLRALAAHSAVVRISHDRPVVATMERTGGTIGAAWVRQSLGYTGAGVGVAIVDSGVTSWHDDLAGSTGSRVVRFVDFVRGYAAPYDDFGHGTHVAGIIAGNGYDSGGARMGVAPNAHLIVLKVLDGAGRGYLSDVIAAIDYAIANRATYQIRVINLSVAAGVYESYRTDPLALAAKRAVEAGLVVVTAAGNLGRNSEGAPQYGGITAPGNAPWVITVGASSHMGTVDRSDDTVTAFSSRGPTAFDYLAKPDLVAPGVGIESLTEPSSALYATYPQWLLPGTVPTWYKPYMALAGTSMAAPVVAGTVALMLEANPALTPNAVKAILQYTAQRYPAYTGLVQGAGFVNARGAVHLAELFAGKPETPEAQADEATWSRQIIWGNHRLGGGMILPTANAWGENIVWGSALTPEGDNIVWGTLCSDSTCDNIVWGTSDPSADNIVWGTSRVEDNIVWGSGTDENIVWGTECGGADCENIVWGSACDADGCENIVWGTAQPGDNIVWGSSGLVDNIVWGTSGGADNIVWGSLVAADNVVWTPVTSTTTTTTSKSSGGSTKKRSK
jgi:serine protease AprX